MRLDSCEMVRAVADGEYTAGDHGMQSLNAPVEHLRETRQLSHIAHCYSGPAQHRGRSSGRYQLNAERLKSGAEVGQPRFISHTDQSTPDFRHGKDYFAT